MSDPLQGFLTKNQVVERYHRSHRQLTRDLSAAVRAKKNDVLQHLRLKTDDGELRDGVKVTHELIQDLSNRGLAPTWYIAEAWANDAFAKEHSSSVKSQPNQQHSADSHQAPTAAVYSDDYVVALLGQITDLKNDKEVLIQQLRTKDEQISAANERTRESNILMQDLHRLLGSPERLKQPASEASTADAVSDESSSSSAHAPRKKKQATRSTAARSPSTKKKSRAKPRKSRSKQPAARSFFATATPTFYEAAKRLRRTPRSS